MISILMPTRSRIDLLPKAFASLLLQMDDCQEEWEVIVLNDNKREHDPIGPILHSMGIHWVRGQGEGTAWAFEDAVAASRGDKLLFTNDDMFFIQPFILPMLERYHQGYKIVGSKLIYDNLTIQHAGMLFLEKEQWNSYHVYRHYPRDAKEVNEFKSYPSVTFSLTLVDRQLFSDLDGFDKEYKGNFEDTDFCLRALENGAKICYEPRAEAIHYESATRGTDLNTNLRTYNLFNSRWIRSGKLKDLLERKGFNYVPEFAY